jgi:hypothetical protein
MDAKRTIPELRRALLAISGRLVAFGEEEMAEDILQIVREMYRNSPSRPRARTKHPPLTGRQIMEIRIFTRENPDIHITEVATLFGTNPGRVSEALRNM